MTTTPMTTTIIPLTPAKPKRRYRVRTVPLRSVYDMRRTTAAWHELIRAGWREMTVIANVATMAKRIA